MRRQRKLQIIFNKTLKKTAFLPDFCVKKQTNKQADKN